MKLSELDPRFIKKADDSESQGKCMIIIAADMKEAHGVMLKCPKCASERMHKDIHRIIIWFEGTVPDDTAPGPGRWAASGTGLEDLTLHPSVELGDLCRCKCTIMAGFVTVDL
jgi:hypothetical protein